jgi:hypothetical protein
MASPHEVQLPVMSVIHAAEGGVDRGVTSFFPLLKVLAHVLILKGIHARETPHGLLIELHGAHGFLGDRHALLEPGELGFEVGANVAEEFGGEGRIH